MGFHNRPASRLPGGVTPGLWDYVRTDAIADDYDQYFAQNKLFEFDAEVLRIQLDKQHLSSDSVIADLGCGTGRALIAQSERGCRGLAVDLSSRMLGVVQQKAREARMQVDCLQANLVELDGVQDRSVDAAICLFSTLGMIRGRENRHRALCQVRRILKPGSPFVLHVHNYWYNLFDPGGPWWVLRGYVRAIFDRQFDPGDKFFPYRGVPNMYLHVFTRGEVTRMLRAAGFEVRHVIPLDPRRHRALRWPALFGRLRANGWIVVARSVCE